MDLSREPNSPEAKMFRDVAKLPLDIESLSKDTSLTTIEAIAMYAQAVQCESVAVIDIIPNNNVILSDRVG
jgi:hypothetical protein